MNDGIDNYGRTIMSGFALLNNETKDSYDWVFRRLKKVWNSDPSYFISDESNEIISGKIFFFFNSLIRN